MIKVAAAFNASGLAVLFESQPLDLDLDVYDQLFYTSVDQTSTSVEFSLHFQRLTLFVYRGILNFGREFVTFGRLNVNFGRHCSSILESPLFFNLALN